MSYTEQELANRLLRLLRDRSVVQGYSRMGGRSGGTVTIVTDDGILQATAVGSFPPGDCLAIRDPDTQEWFAYSAHASQVVRSQTYRRQARIASESATGPVKVLFSVVKDGVREFYVGGDRLVPVKIFSLPANLGFVLPYITNTGRGKNQWLVSIAYFSSSGFAIQEIKPGSSINSVGNSTLPFVYRGAGFWLAELDANSRFSPVTVSGNNASYVYSPYTSTGGISAAFNDSNELSRWSANMSTSVQIQSIYAGQLQENIGTVLHSENFEKTSSAASSATAQTYSGTTFLLPNQTHEVSASYSDSKSSPGLSSGNYNIDFAYCLLLEAKGKSALTIETLGGEAIALNWDGRPFGFGASQPTTGVFYPIDLQFLFRTPPKTYLLKESGDRIEIITPLSAINMSRANLVSNKILIAPIDAYSNQNLESQVEQYIIQDDGMIASVNRSAKIFSLRSPDCTIHSASAYL